MPLGATRPQARARRAWLAPSIAAGACAAALGLCAGGPSWAQDRRSPELDPSRGDPSPDADSGPEPGGADPRWDLAAGARGDELSPDVRRAIDDGVAWLAREQVARSGRWPSTPPDYEMSVTALAGLALLAHGETPEHGPYSRNLRMALLWVLDNQRTEGEFAGLLFEGDQGRRDPMESEQRPMHGHGFALLFLGECYGQTSDPVLRERIHRALSLGAGLTARSISPDGGWFYYPAPATGGGMRDEGSVTITQIQGLRSARDAGVAVDPEVVRRAVAYIHESQQPDGGVRYTRNGGKTSAALTAAGIACLQGAGEYYSDPIERAYGYLRQNLSYDGDQRWFYYTHLYASQAMFQRGGAEWASYLPRIQRELLWRRKGHPYWESPFGHSYATAISLLILQVPLRYLPIHQR